ncbi:MAG: WD40 repeat domain-containing serine/threonine protein kinase, partial [Arenimonas sp.]
MTETRVLSSTATPTTAADLARLAFAMRPSGEDAGSMGPRHLAFLPPEALALDLSDPAQREFGDYELLEKIGQGGMGVVYRAQQKDLQREVALKLLAAGPWASSDFIQRFQREAQSAARMEHPNIVTVFETGSHEDLHYFSMRLVRGQSLAARLRESGRLTPFDAARLTRTIAEAVDYAHRLHVLHLDLKPGNILIDENGEPLVADFGLARRLDQALADHSDEVSGTPSYMAPEQAHARSQTIGTCTDIYGLGAVLYEMLTGEPPFVGATPQETLASVVIGNPVPPRKHNAEIPADLEAICLKCLSKEPSGRYTRSRQLADDLSRFLEGRPVSARPLNGAQRVLRYARRDPKLTGLVAMLFFSLLFGFGISAVQWRRAESNAEASRGLLWDGRRETALRLEMAGDGFAALPQLIANLGEEENAGKTSAAALERRRIGMLIGQGATLIDRFTIADANPMATEISPDGRLLAMSFNDLSVRWYDTATLTERGRVSLADLSKASGERAPVFLLRFVDNHRLRATLEWVSNLVSPDDGDTWMIDIDHQQLIRPPAAFADFGDATFSSDGRIALLRNRQRQQQLWQVEPWRPLAPLARVQMPVATDFLPWLIDPRGRFAVSLGEELRELHFYDLPDLSRPQSVRLSGNAGISAWALSGNGRVLALGDFEGRVFLLDTATRTVRALATARGREITWITFSEDDVWLATAGFDGAVHAFDVNSGDSLVAGQMIHDFPLRRVGLSHGKRLLIAAGEGRSALWRLPLPGPRAIPAQRIGL